MADEIYEITGSLDIDFDRVAFDSKKDFKEVKSKIRVAARKIIDDYNGAGVELEFMDDTNIQRLE